MGTAAVGLAAALVLLVAGYPIAAFAIAVPCGVLGYAALRDLVSLELGAGLALLLELVLLGSVWPSIHTLAALLVLPALGITVWCLVRRRTPKRSALYLSASSLVASCSLLWQAYLLATL